MTDSPHRSDSKHVELGLLLRGLERSWALLALATTLACAPALTVREAELSGAFTGSTPEGEAVSLVFTDENEAFRGVGSIGQRPVALAGPSVWRGVGALSDGGGGDRPVELALSADGERLEVAIDGGATLRLDRATGSAPAASGGFSGRYRGFRAKDLAATVTLVQTGELLSGTGILLGDPFGVSGRVERGRFAEGVVTFADGTLSRFSATLDDDGDSLRVRGLAAALEWRREGSKR